MRTPGLTFGSAPQTPPRRLCSGPARAEIQKPAAQGPGAGAERPSGTIGGSGGRGGVGGVRWAARNSTGIHPLPPGGTATTHRWGKQPPPPPGSWPEAGQFGHWLLADPPQGMREGGGVIEGVLGRPPSVQTKKSLAQKKTAYWGFENENSDKI